MDKVKKNARNATVEKLIIMATILENTNCSKFNIQVLIAIKSICMKYVLVNSLELLSVPQTKAVNAIYCFLNYINFQCFDKQYNTTLPQNY